MNFYIKVEKRKKCLKIHLGSCSSLSSGLDSQKITNSERFSNFITSYSLSLVLFCVIELLNQSMNDTKRKQQNSRKGTTRSLSRFAFLFLRGRKILLSLERSAFSCNLILNRNILNCSAFMMSIFDVRGPVLECTMKHTTENGVCGRRRNSEIEDFVAGWRKSA